MAHPWLTAMGKLRRRVRAEGFWRAGQRVLDHACFLWDRWRNDAFDRKYGTDTARGNGTTPLGEGEGSGEHSTGYYPTRIAVFQRIIRALQVDFTQYTFIDFGSGKGRALLLAAEHPFRRVVGIEFAPDLCATARTNVARFQQHRATAPIEIHCQDALTYPLPEEDTVCFFYNPFDAVILAEVIQNLERSCRQTPRRLKVVYLNPVHADLFDRADFLHLSLADPKFRIYQTQECDISPS
jgi:SAM-dependent methyltransferase